MSRIRHSGKIKGALRNGVADEPIEADFSGGYVGINQVRFRGEMDRVLISPSQWNWLRKFVNESRGKQRKRSTR